MSPAEGAVDAGTLKGKYGYMSPEQVRQRPVDRRSDVWSLGVCLWEMLTRKRLFRSDGALETLRAVTEEPIRPPSEVRPDLPMAFDTIVMRALERDPDRRYESARVFARALNDAIRTAGGTSNADAAELMDRVFPRAREKHRKLIEGARSVEADEGLSSGSRSLAAAEARAAEAVARAAEAEARAEAGTGTETETETGTETGTEVPSRPNRPRMTRSAPAQATANATGTVNVVTPPGWAEVLVGSRRVGRSPGEIRLPAGRQSLRLMPYGEGPAIRRSVVVPANGITRVVVRLRD